MKSSIKKLVISLASALVFANFSVKASDTYVFRNVPLNKQGAVYEFYSKYSFPGILNKENQDEFKKNYAGGGNSTKVFETKKGEFDFISKEIKNIKECEKVETIPVTKSLYELIAYTCMIEKGKIIVDDEGIKYKEAEDTELVQDFFDPMSYNVSLSITERFKWFISGLGNTFWLVNEYAQQYVDEKGVKEDALKTLLDKFQKRNVDQQIHERCDRHSLLVAALQQDKNYEYGNKLKFSKNDIEAILLAEKYPNNPEIQKSTKIIWQNLDLRKRAIAAKSDL